MIQRTYPPAPQPTLWERVLGWLRGSAANRAIAATTTTAVAGASMMALLAPDNRQLSGYPRDSDTGPAASVSLTEYAGTCTLSTTGATLTAVEVDNCPSGLTVSGRRVKIVRSVVNTSITVTSTGTLTLDQSEVHAGDHAGPAVAGANLTVSRTEVTGGTSLVTCTLNCTVQDSWLHTPGTGATVGLEATGKSFRALHNTVDCNVATCEAAIRMDSSPRATLETNLLRVNAAMPFCLEFSSTNLPVILNNAFEPDCGEETATGLIAESYTWTGNFYADDRAPAEPPTEDPGGGDWTFPSTEDNVGVPAGTTLTDYVGSCNVTVPDTIISAKNVECSPLFIQTTGVLIENSIVDGGVSVGDYLDEAYSDGYNVGTDPVPSASDVTLDYFGEGEPHVTIVDSELLATGDFRPISVSHFSVLRTLMDLGHSGGECHNAGRVEKSFARGYGEHASGFRVLRNCVELDSTFWCEPNYEADEDNNGIPDADGGCSADQVMYEQFGRPGNNLMEHNYWPATLAFYCIRQDGGPGDGGQVFLNNRMEKGPGGGVAGPNCGQSSPIEGFEGGSASYTGNEYTDGTPITGST